MLTDAGLAEGRDGQAETSATIRPAVELAADDQAENERCAISIGPTNPRRKVRMAEHSTPTASAPSCPGGRVGAAPLAGPSLEARRRRIDQHYGLDPLSGQLTATEIEWLRFPLDGTACRSPSRSSGPSRPGCSPWVCPAATGAKRGPGLATGVPLS